MLPIWRFTLMKKLGSFLLICVLIFFPIYKLITFSVTINSSLSEKLGVLQASITQTSNDGKVNHEQMLDKRVQMIHEVGQAVEMLIVMYNRVVAILAMSLVIVIGIAVWRTIEKPNRKND